jgi:Xaa-Pro aminopeptidase
MRDSDLNRRELLKLAALAAGGAVSLHPDGFGQNQSPSAKGSGSQDWVGRGKDKDNGAASLHPPAEVATLYSKEYGRHRIQKIQAAIRQADLDALIVTNRCLDYIGYVSNFHPYPLEPGMALVLADGPSTLFVNTYSSAHTRALIPLVRTDELVDVPRDSVSEGSNQNLVNACIQRLQDRKLQRGRVGLAGDEIDWLLPFYFRDRLPDLKVEDANRTLTQVIVVKDEVELALIRFAQRLIDEVAYPSFRRELHPGAMDQLVYARVLAGMIEWGANPATVLLFDAGPAGSGTWASGIRGRKLEKSDIILSEPTPNIAGYQSEKMYTFALGREIPESQKRGSEVIYEAYQLLMSELKVGRELTPIVQSVEAFIRDHGYEGSTVPVGHWIGTQNHEGPRFTVEGTRGWLLQKDMVMSWHPNLVVPGKVRTTCSTCVVLTDKGAQDLSTVKMEPIYYLD